MFPGISTLVALALAIWGWAAPLPYALRDGRSVNNDAAAWVQRYPEPGRPCEIWLGPQWDPLSWLGQLSVMVHEVGHCLGLNHNDLQSVMNQGFVFIIGRPTAIDYAHLGITVRRSTFIPEVSSGD